MKAEQYKKATETMTPAEKSFYDILVKMLDILERAAGSDEP